MPLPFQKTPQPPLCPLLSKLGEVSALAGPGTSAPFNVVRCQGPACALFVQGFDADGKPTGVGYCAYTMNAISLAQIAAAVQEFVNGTDDDDPAAPVDPASPSA